MKRFLTALLFLGAVGVARADITSIITLPSGSSNEVQFRDAGIFGSSSTFTFNKNTGLLSVPRISIGLITFTGDSTTLNSGSVISGSDNMGSHIATTTLNMGGFGISNIGGASSFDSSGALTVGSTLTVSGATFSIRGVDYYFPLTSGTSGYFLKTLANGTLEWAQSSGSDDLGDHTATQDLNMGNFRIYGIGSGGSAFDAGGNLSVSTMAVTGATVTLRGLKYIVPSTYTAGTEGVWVNDGSGNLTWEEAITDAAQTGSYNSFTSSNVFNNYGLYLDEISAPSTPGTGYGVLYVNSSDSALYFKGDDGTAHNLESGGSGGSGDWNTTAGIHYSTTTPVIVGHTTGTVAGTIFGIQDGTNNLFYTDGTDTKFTNLTSMTWDNVSTMTVTAATFTFTAGMVDVSNGKLKIKYTNTCPSADNGVLCFDEDNTTLYVGTYTVSGGGGGTPGGSNENVQFNNANAFGGDTNFTFNTNNNQLTVDSIKLDSPLPFLTINDTDAGGSDSEAGIHFGVLGSTFSRISPYNNNFVVYASTSGGGDLPERWFVNTQSGSEQFFNRNLNGFTLKVASMTFESVSQDPTMDWATDGQIQFSNTDVKVSSASALNLSSVTFNHEGQTILTSSTPVSISTHTNSWNIPAYTIIRASVTASGVQIRGIANGVAGREITVFLVGSQGAQFMHQNSSAVASERLNLGTGNLTISSDRSITLWYDGTDQRWRYKE